MKLSELEYKPRKLQEGEKYLGVSLNGGNDCELKLSGFTNPVIVEKGYGAQVTDYFLIAENEPQIMEQRIETREQFLKHNYLTHEN